MKNFIAIYENSIEKPPELIQGNVFQIDYYKDVYFWIYKR